jgi:hypothetical protein
MPSGKQKLLRRDVIQLAMASAAFAGTTTYTEAQPTPTNASSAEKPLGEVGATEAAGAVDPVSAVLGVVSFIASSDAQNSTAKWQNVTSRSLDKILNNTIEILAEMKQLRAEIKQDFIDSKLQELISDVHASKQMLDVALAGARSLDRVSKSQVKRIVGIGERTEFNCYKLMDIGVGGYQQVAGAFAIVTAIYKITKVPKASYSELCDKYSAFFSRCIDPKEAKSFASVSIDIDGVLRENPKYLDSVDACVRAWCLVGKGFAQAGIGPMGDGWWMAKFGGNRQSGYGVDAFGLGLFLGGTGTYNYFPKFTMDVMDEQDARRRANDMADFAKAQEADIRWAYANKPLIANTISQVRLLISAVAASKHNYRNV